MRFITTEEGEDKIITSKVTKDDVNIECDDELVAWFSGENKEFVVDKAGLKRMGIEFRFMK